MTHTWDVSRYLAYADERSRPFVELLQRVDADDPEVVVDLGCGPGHLTGLLLDRWPGARVVGVDSSPDMIAAARAAQPGLTFEQADLRDWLAGARDVDVLLSNATLQWVPGHLDLLPALVGAVRPGGTLAFGVPGNFDEPSHVLRRELAADERYAPHLQGVAVPDAHDGATYLAALAELGCAVDAWETTYLHVLAGTDPVYEWVTGTGARPTLQALPEPLRAEFAARFRAGLREAYPPTAHGVVLPFRRVFVVARTPG